MATSFCGGRSRREPSPGADPGFQVRGAQLKKLGPAEGGANIFGVFRVKNHDFTPKNHIFSNCGGRCKIFGVFRVKNDDFTPKNHIFSNFRGGGGGGGGAGCAAPDHHGQATGKLYHLRVECTLFVIYKAGREPTPYWW